MLFFQFTAVKRCCGVLHASSRTYREDLNNAAAESGSPDMVPTSPVVPTLSQPPERVEDTKSHSKTTVSLTSPGGPNVLLHIHVGERKRSGTCFSIRKEKGPRWGHRGWDYIRSSHWTGTINLCLNPSKVGATRSEVGTGADRTSITGRRRAHRRFRFGVGPPDATSCSDRSRRPTACEPSR